MLRVLLGFLFVSCAVVAMASDEANEAAQKFAKAKFNYLLHCRGCHLPDGRGTPPEVPTLINELGKIVQVPRGRDYLVRVPGSAQAPLDDQELAEVINWILVNFNQETLPDNFTPLKAKEVGRARKHVLADPLKYRAEIWQAYSH